MLYYEERAYAEIETVYRRDWECNLNCVTSIFPFTGPFAPVT
jgi:hypothetical protein